MADIVLRLTPDEAAMLTRGYIDGMPGGVTAVHQALTSKLERLRYESQGHRAVASSKTIAARNPAHGKATARV